MSTDLSRALAELAEQAGDQASLASPESLVARRRRRRQVRRGAAATVGLAAVGGLVLAGATLADWRVDRPQPAITGPSPSPSTDALPGCGDAVPTPGSTAGTDGTVLTAVAPSVGTATTDGVPTHLDLTVGGTGAPTAQDLDGSAVRVLLVAGDEVVAAGDLPGDAAWAGLEDGTGTAAATVDAMLPLCAALPVDVQVVVVARTDQGLLVSAPVTAEHRTETSGETVHPGGTGGSTSTLPLPDPMVERWSGSGRLVSDVPDSDDGLADGSYFGELQSVSAASGTISVDIGIFYGGDAAREWVAANDPGALSDDDVLDGYWIVNEVVRPRTLTLAPDAVVTGYCNAAGRIRMERLTLETLAAAPDSSASCDAQSSVRAGQWFWIDVRDGLVAQVVGQYRP